MMDAVVFDLDGVLIDSEPVWERVRRAYVAERAGRWLPDSQRRLMGMSTPEWARYLSDDLDVDVGPEQVAKDVIQRMADSFEHDLPVIPGAIDAVRRMGTRWLLGLASSSARLLIDRVIAAAGLTSQFAVTLSTEEVDRGKPAPDVYLAVAQRIGVPATRCVAVEDSSNGVRAARAAGAVVVAVPHHRYPLEPDARAQAAVVLDSISELTVEHLAALDLG